MSQKQLVLNILRTDGVITRNQCLRMFISRLGSLIKLLEYEEKIEVTERGYKDGDYFYKVEPLRPKEVIEYRVQGELVAKKVIW